MKQESEAGPVQTADVRGNFDIGTCLGEAKCVHGHPIRLFNIGRDHLVACDRCRTFIHISSNLMGYWRLENAGIWERNWRRRSMNSAVFTTSQ
jgi:hypothetical protein